MHTNTHVHTCTHTCADVLRHVRLGCSAESGKVQKFSRQLGETVQNASALAASVSKKVRDLDEVRVRARLAAPASRARCVSVRRG